MPPFQRKTLPEPNKDKPLAEPSLNRRLWAAYLHRGYTHADAARMLGIHYTGLHNIVTGKSGVPKLQTLILASQLFGFTLDELVFGHERPTGAEVELTRDGVKALLLKLGAHDDVIERLGDYTHSAAGHFQTFTRAWVEALNQDYRAAVDEDGLEPAKAFERAKGAAAKARALAATTAAKRIVTPIKDSAELAAMGRAADGANAPPVLHALPGGAKKKRARKKKSGGAAAPTKSKRA